MTNLKTFNIDADSLNFDFSYNPKETKFLKEDIENKKDITLCDIRRISLWKLDRVLEVSEDTISNLQQIAVKDDLTIKSELVSVTLNMLVNSNGIGYPMASSILKFIRPDIFPIIDVRAYRAVYGKKIYSSQYTVKKYFDYVEKIYDISKSLNIELCKVDEQLYCFNKEYNRLLA